MFKTKRDLKITINDGEEVFCSIIEFVSKEVIATLYNKEQRYFDRVDVVSISEDNEPLKMLDGLVSDVGNLLCDVADLDFEWQQAGYYETAKKWLNENKK